MPTVIARVLAAIRWPHHQMACARAYLV